MKVLHIINYFQPILGYQETYLAKADKKKGHQVQVITSDRYAPVLFKGEASKQILGSRIQSPGFFKEDGIDVLRLGTRFEALNNTWLTNLEKSVLEFNPDVVFVHGVCSITSIRIALLKKNMKGTRLIFDDHMNFLPRRGKWVNFFYKIFKIVFSGIILKNADQLVAVTSETKLFMSKMYGLPSNKIHLIPLGCDTKIFSRDDFWRYSLRDKFGITIKQTVFCYVGKIIPDKGIDLLINAAISLIESHRDIVVLLVGAQDFSYLEFLKNKVKTTSFQNRFVFIPPVPSKDLYMYYSMADIGVWPKQCSITMLEAMACGIPVIVPNNSKAPDGVASNGSGFFYEEDNLNDLIAKMDSLMDPQIRLPMGEKARTVAELYDWDKISKSFESLYKNLSSRVDYAI